MMTGRRRRRAALVAWSLAVSCAAAAGDIAPCAGCNVILVSMDTMRADALGVLGSSRPITPNLDKLASRGVLFTQAFSQAPNTLPSHMSLFTGLYPWRHEVNVPLRDRLAADIPTLPQLLQKNGYHTYWLAKQVNLILSAGFAKGFDKLDEPGPRPFHKAAIWLKTKPPGPFFAFFHSNHLHGPYFPKFKSVWTLDPSANALHYPSRREWYRSVRPIAMANPGMLAHILSRDPLHKRFYWSNFALDRPGATASLRLRYDALVLELDEGVGRLMNALEVAGLADKTLVIFTADHGEEFFEHGRMQHTQLYQECLHVPMLILHPKAPGGRKVTQVVSNIDVLPTILEALDIKPPQELDGISLLAAVAGRPLPEPRHTLAAWRSKFAARNAEVTYMASISPKGLPTFEKLYDRLIDPQEKINLLPARDKEATAWRALIPDALKTPGRPRAWPKNVDAETRRRALKTGYW